MSYTIIHYPGFKKGVVKELLPLAKVHDINDNELKTFLINLLEFRGNVKREIAEQLFDEQGLKFIKQAFTHPSMLEYQNYEFYELLGDTSANKCILWYIYRRIPSLKNEDNPAMLMTELKKKYVSKKLFSPFCKTLGLHNFIRWKELSYMELDNIKTVLMDDSMYEDVFESFCGCLEDLIDTRIMPLTGIGVLYNIISTVMDGIEIITDLTELFDPKSQIKELLEDPKVSKYIEKQIVYNKLKTQSNKKKVSLDLIFKEYPCKPSSELIEKDGKLIKTIISNEHFTVQEAEKDAAKKALNWLSKTCDFTWKPK
jgi:dsRNA-specific ribonuclease